MTEKSKVGIKLLEVMQFGLPKHSVYSTSPPVEVTCHIQIRPKHRNTTLAGCSDGRIICWKSTNEFGPGQSREIWHEHKGKVMALASLDHTCADGVVVSGSSSGTMKFWAPWVFAVGRKSVLTLKDQHEGTVLALTSFEDMLISSGTDGKVHIYTVSHKTNAYVKVDKIQTLDFNGRWVTSLCAVKQDGPTLSIGTQDGNCFFYEPTMNDDTGEWKWHQETFGNTSQKTRLHRLGVSALTVSERDNFLCTISRDWWFKVFELRAGMVTLQKSNPNKCHYTALAYNDHSHELILADSKGQIQIWKVLLGMLTFSQTVCEKGIPSLSLGLEFNSFTVSVMKPDTHELTLQVWHIDRESVDKQLRGHVDAIVGLFEADVRPTAKTNPGRAGKSRRLSPASKSLSLKGYVPPEDRHTHKEMIKAAEVSSANRTFSISRDCSIRCWDLYDNTCLQTNKAGTSEISSAIMIPSKLALSIDGSATFVIGHDDGTQSIWNTGTNACSQYHFHTNTVTHATFHKWPQRHRAYVVSSSYDGYVTVIDLYQDKGNPQLKGRLESKHKIADCELLCVIGILKPSSGQNLCLTGCNDGLIRVFDWNKKVALEPLKGHQESVTNIVRDGNMIISGSDDWTLRVWDLVSTSMICVAVLESHSAPITTMKMLPQIGFLVSAGQDGKVILWDYPTGLVVKNISHLSNVRALTFADSSKELIVGLENGRIYRHSFVAKYAHFVRSAHSRRETGARHSQSRQLQLQSKMKTIRRGMYELTKDSVALKMGFATDGKTQSNAKGENDQKGSPRKSKGDGKTGPRGSPNNKDPIPLVSIERLQFLATHDDLLDAAAGMTDPCGWTAQEEAHSLVAGNTEVCAPMILPIDQDFENLKQENKLLQAQNAQAMKRRGYNPNADRASTEKAKLEEKKIKAEEEREEVRRAWDQAFFRNLDQRLIHHEMMSSEGKVEWGSVAGSRMGTSKTSRRGSAVLNPKGLARSLDVDEGERESESSDCDTSSTLCDLLKNSDVETNVVYSDDRVLKLAELGPYKSMLKLSRPPKVGSSKGRGIFRGISKIPSNSTLNTARNTGRSLTSVRLPDYKGDDGVSIFSFGGRKIPMGTSPVTEE